MMLGLVDNVYTLFIWGGGAGRWFNFCVVWVSLNSQRRLWKFLVPVRRTFPFFVISTFLLSKVALQPASHSCPMDTSDAKRNAGKMRARVAAGGRSEMGRWVSWVLAMSWPDGSWTDIGFVVGTEGVMV